MEIAPLPGSLYEDALALWRATGLTRPWNDPSDDLRRAMLGPDSVVLAAVEGQALLATAMVGHDGHRGWVYYLAVANEQQRQGLGRLMMQACEQWVHARGIPKVQLMVRRDNEQAATFYRHLGYEPSAVTVFARRLRPSPQEPDELR